MTAAYWLIGRRIVVSEQAGSARADYGQALIKRLSTDLTAKFGRGFGAVNLSQMKRFYLLWPSDRIFQTPSEKFQSFLMKWNWHKRLNEPRQPFRNEKKRTPALPQKGRGRKSAESKQ